MSWQLTIGGVDYSQYSDFRSWRIYRTNRHRGSMANGSVVIESKAIERPKTLQKVVLKEVGGDTLFGGILQRCEQVPLGSVTYEYMLECSDLTRWLDHIPVGAKVYTGTVDTVVKDIISDWVTLSVGDVFGDPPPDAPITVNNVKPSSITIFSFQGNFTPVSQVLDQLAKMVQYIWFIDPDGDLWFCRCNDPDLHAPLPASDITFFDQDLVGSQSKGPVTESLPTINADEDTLLTRYRNLKITEDTSTMITGIHVRNYMEASTEHVTEDDTTKEDLIGNGTTKFFGLYNQPIDPDHTKVTVDYDGTPKVYDVASGNMLTEYVDGHPTDASPGDNCYVCSTNTGMRFGVAPASGKKIKAEFNYFFGPAGDLKKNVELRHEVADREGFGGGMYYQIISDAALTSPIAADEGIPSWQAVMIINLNRYGRIKILANFETYIKGWSPGQIFAIVSLNRGQKTANPILALFGRAYDVWPVTFSMKFFVTQIEISFINDNDLLTTVQAASDIWGE